MAAAAAEGDPRGGLTGLRLRPELLGTRGVLGTRGGPLVGVTLLADGRLAAAAGGERAEEVVVGRAGVEPGVEAVRVGGALEAAARAAASWVRGREAEAEEPRLTEGGGGRSGGVAKGGGGVAKLGDAEGGRAPARAGAWAAEVGRQVGTPQGPPAARGIPRDETRSGRRDACAWEGGPAAAAEPASCWRAGGPGGGRLGCGEGCGEGCGGATTWSMKDCMRARMKGSRRIWLRWGRPAGSLESMSPTSLRRLGLGLGLGLGLMLGLELGSGSGLGLG